MQYYRSILAILAIAIAFILVPITSASAHKAGQLPFFKVDNQYPALYFVQNDLVQHLEIPQTLAAKRFLVGQKITFGLETNVMEAPQELLDRSIFTTDFGDGTTATGTAYDHTYQRAGSYIVKVYAEADGQSQLIESCLVHIVPNDNYRLPEARINFNGQAVTDNAKTYTYTLGSAVVLDASASRPGSSPVTRYQWDLADGRQATGAIVKHTYASDVQLAGPVVRVFDSNGLFADAYVDVQPSDAASSGSSVDIGQAYDTAVNWMKRSVSKVFDGGTTNYLLAAGVLLFAVVAGALHALTPGHGKSVMAALLVGRRGSKFADVAIIAAAVTITHTAVIFILGFLFLVVDTSYSIGTLMPYFVRLSGAIVLLLALSLLWNGYRRWRSQRQERSHAAAHAAGHAHEHSHSHDHEHGHTHSYVQKRPGRWGLFLAGASGGIIPCIDALSLLLLSVGVGKVGFGILLVLGFSFGLATAIFGLGLLLLAGKAKLESYDRLGTFASVYMPMISGLFIMALALLIIFNA